MVNKPSGGKKSVAKAPSLQRTEAAQAPSRKTKSQSATLAAKAMLNVTVSKDYGTVDVGQWDLQPPPSQLIVANMCSFANEVLGLPVYHTDGVFRDRSRLEKLDHIPNAPCSDGVATLDLYLVHVVSIT